VQQQGKDQQHWFRWAALCVSSGCFLKDSRRVALMLCIVVLVVGVVKHLRGSLCSGDRAAMQIEIPYLM
jgi:hypothetical protein